MKRIKYKARIEAASLEIFQSAVMEWYSGHGRDLPWRKTRDPYAVIVSEIMLHQTTVATVTPVYQRFMECFPDVVTLSDAALEDVKAITDPLGYKIRGRWLKDIARAVVHEWGGEWPNTVEGLMSLPGVGRYTAGAVLSFAFGQDAPILDTNVKRVLGRYFGIAFRETRAEVQHHLWALAEAVLPPGRAEDFNQALMDFGAMVCTARKPACTVCPALEQCASAGNDEALAAAEDRGRYELEVRPKEETG